MWPHQVMPWIGRESGKSRPSTFQYINKFVSIILPLSARVVLTVDQYRRIHMERCIIWLNNFCYLFQLANSLGMNLYSIDVNEMNNKTNLSKSLLWYTTRSACSTVVYYCVHEMKDIRIDLIWHRFNPSLVFQTERSCLPFYCHHQN